MSTALYIFRLVWPFLKEYLLGGLTLREGIKSQKKRVFLLFFVSGLIFLLFLIIPRFLMLSQEHVKLEKSVELANVSRLETRLKELEQINQNLINNNRPDYYRQEQEDQLDAARKAVRDADRSPIPVPGKPETVASPSPPPTTPVTPGPPPRVPPRQGDERHDRSDRNDRKKAYMDFFDNHDD